MTPCGKRLRAARASATLGLCFVASLQPVSVLRSQPARQDALPPLQQQWQQQGAPPTPSLDAPAPSLDNNAPDGGTPHGATPDGAILDGGIPNDGTSDNGDGAGRTPPPAQGPSTFTPPSSWMPARTARLQALDKVNAQSSDLTVPVGQSVGFGSLTIAVKACVIRPSDQPADAAAFLDVTDAHPDANGFSGWMLWKEPSVSMMQHPLYDLRITGCG